MKKTYDLQGAARATALAGMVDVAAGATAVAMVAAAMVICLQGTQEGPHIPASRFRNDL
jgi:hypothetical protein